jgi:hypothetical protein
MISYLTSLHFVPVPTGIAAYALVYFMHHVIHMLETNAYVHYLCLKFSKAFDRVDNFILIGKLSKLKLPRPVYFKLGYFISYE